MLDLLKDENTAFTQRLFLALNSIGYEVTNITGITREINKLFGEKSITSHAVRKWLSGQAIPIHSRLIRLADWLGVSPAWLRFGEGQMYKSNLSLIPFSEEKNYSLIFAKIKSLSKEELELVTHQIELILKIRKLHKQNK
jgi:transcriptional regulator with XRE-family HTH domain